MLGGQELSGLGLGIWALGGGGGGAVTHEYTIHQSCMTSGMTSGMTCPVGGPFIWVGPGGEEGSRLPGLGCSLSWCFERTGTGHHALHTAYLLA